MKKIIGLLTVILIITSYSLQSQNWIWAEHFKSANDVYPRCTGTDIDGNVYTTGTFTGSLDIGTETITGYGMKDCYITKMDKNGKLIWTRKIGGTNDEEPTKMVLDNKGHLYITGYFRSTPTTFDATHTLTNTNLRDAFIARYDTAGNVQFAISAFWGTSGQTINSITLSPSEDTIYVFGTFTTELKYELGGEQTMVPKGTRDYFVAKFDTLGNLKKIVQYYSNNATASLKNICHNPQNEYFICGDLYGTLTFEQGSSITNPNGALQDALILKINRNLEFQWAREAGGTNYDLGIGCNCDQNGNAYLTGYIYGPATFETGSAPLVVNTTGQDLYIAKYDRAGNLKWVKNNINGTDCGTKLFVKNNLIYLTGYFVGSQTVFNQDTLKSYNTSWDPFIAAFDTSGNIIGAKEMKGKKEDKGDCIYLDNDGYVYNLGSFYSDSLFMPIDTFVNGKNDGTIRNAYLAKSCMIIGINRTVTDVACYGNSTGAIDLTISGDAGPYTYKWSNGATTEDIGNISKGLYTVTVSFKEGECYKSATINVIEAPELVLTPVKTDDLCRDSKGAVSVNVTGGTPGYTYQWNDPSSSTTQTVTGLAKGTYRVTVTDSKGCADTVSSLIGGPDAALSVTFETSSPDCNGGADGSATALPSGATLPYSYNWSNGYTQQTIVNVNAGSYSITVSDKNNCTLTSAVTISEPAGITASFSSTPATCFDGSNGSIDLTPSGGTGNYSYLWSTNSTAQDISNLTGGKYFIFITDENNCMKFDSTVVDQGAEIIISSSKTDATCGQPDGAVYADASGGHGGFSYLWNDLSGATTQTVTNLPAGIYCVTVTDQSGCTNRTSVQINDLSAPTLTLSKTDVSCYATNTGKATVTASGGTPGYSYLWSNGGTDDTILNLYAGTYSVTVSDQTSCKAYGVVFITQPDSIRLTYVKTNVTCFGQNNGKTDLTATGGTGTLSYIWSNGKTTQDISDLVSAKYYITVTDSKGCWKKDSVMISQPADIVLTPAATDDFCSNSNGAVSVSVTGGNGGYTYTWNDPNNTKASTVTGLSKGTYIVIVADSKGCSKNTSAVVNAPDPLSVTFSVTDASCFGGSNASLKANVTGGTTSYFYLWSDGQTEETAAALYAGSYSITVTDSKNCTKTGSTTAGEAAEIILSFNNTNVTCYGENDGAIDLTASGGTGQLSYVWSNGSTTEDISGLDSKKYYLTVTDANSCKKTDSVMVSQPADITLSLSSTDDFCSNSNGAAIVSASGGNGGFTYLWGDAGNSTTATVSGLPKGTFFVTATDSKGCSKTSSVIIGGPDPLSLTFSVTDAPCFAGNNASIKVSVTGGTSSYSYIWSNGQINETAVLPPGTYSVTVTDSKNCTKSGNATAGEAAEIIISFNKTDVPCFGGNNGNIDVTASGGTGQLSYSWSNTSTTEDIGNLIAGNYSITVTDINQCTKIENFEITQPVILSSAVTGTNTCAGSCNGQAIINAAGGATPYSYFWSNAKTGAIINDLCAGNYYVTITDANGCTKENTVNIESIPLPAFDLGKDSVVCADKTITLNAGAGFDSYLWSTGATVNSITLDTNGFGLGVFKFFVTVTDNGCDSVDSVKVTFDICTDVLVSDFSDLKIDIYPNPSRGIFDITITGMRKDCKLSILDATGRVIYSEVILSGADYSRRTDLSNYAKGLYYLKLENDYTIKTEKLVTF